MLHTKPRILTDKTALSYKSTNPNLQSSCLPTIWANHNLFAEAIVFCCDLSAWTNFPNGSIWKQPPLPVSAGIAISMAYVKATYLYQYVITYTPLLGLYIVYFKRYNITIHMKWYSICINDTFCLVLDQKSLIYHQFHRNLGILMTKIP